MGHGSRRYPRQVIALGDASASPRRHRALPGSSPEARTLQPSIDRSASRSTTGPSRYPHVTALDLAELARSASIALWRPAKSCLVFASGDVLLFALLKALRAIWL